MQNQSSVEMPDIRNYSVMSFLDDRHLSRYASKLFENGVETMGDLIAHQEGELFKKFPTTDENKKRVKSVLETFKLSFTN